MFITASILFHALVIMWSVLNILKKKINYITALLNDILNDMLLFLRVRVVKRSTRWTCAATLLPFRSCLSTEIQIPECLWSSLYPPLMTSVRCQLHPAPPRACRDSLFQFPLPTPTPPLAAARSLSAQTTRWCCQNMMMCWLRRPPLLTCRWVRMGFRACEF